MPATLMAFVWATDKKRNGVEEITTISKVYALFEELAGLALDRLVRVLPWRPITRVGCSDVRARRAASPSMLYSFFWPYEWRISSA